MPDQIPLPDRLMFIRQQIAALRAEENAIREVLIADPAARIGNSYVANVREMTSYRVRGKDLEKADPELFAKLARESTLPYVYLVKRVSDDA